MAKYILSLDQGTTSSRAIIFDRGQNIIATEQKEFTQIYPKEGWVEHDPAEIYNTQYEVMQKVIKTAKIKAQDIAAIGITNQRETTIIWDKKTGEPVYNAIVWQCRRTSDIVDKLVRDGLGDHIKKVTGLVPDAYFSGTKIKWILDNEQGAMSSEQGAGNREQRAVSSEQLRERAKKGEILFGTVDTWLIWKLSGGKAHVTDYTNASRTMIFDIHKLDWDDKLLEALDIPREMLPKVQPSGSMFATANIEGAQIPIAGVAGDQQAALFGQCCFEKGEVKCTYGTGCFLLMNTGSETAVSKNGLLTTLAATLDGSSIQYVLEGSVFTGGAVIQWLRDEMKLIESSVESEKYANEAADTGGVYLVPAFTGLGAPYWDMYARGTIVGITRGTKRAHIIRAAEEAIAYQVMDLLCAMEKDLDISLKEIKVDGGASRDKFLMQFQADMCGADIVRPVVRETTALGAACLAGITIGFWKDQNEVKAHWQKDVVFKPQMEAGERDKLIVGWHKAVERSRNWSGY